MSQSNAAEETRDILAYQALPTILNFHNSMAKIRAIVGPVGSGKTSGAAQEICYEIPRFLFETYGITDTRFVVVRNTYVELIDTTQRTVFDWFSWGDYKAGLKNYTMHWPDGFNVELLFRSCDRAEDVKKFKSLELTGYWIDESIEVDEAIKRMLKNRIGRFPKLDVWIKSMQKKPRWKGISYDKLNRELHDHADDYHMKFGVETTNPPDVEHPTYSQFVWDPLPPGPVPTTAPLEDHEGFWQPPYENVMNLTPGYYEDLKNDYRDNPDWIQTYIESKPGLIIKGKLVYNNFKRETHVAKQPLIWAKGTLFRGWDNSGNTPACVVVQVPRPRHAQILKEFHTERMGIVDFGNYVAGECNLLWTNATYVDWADPAGENEYSKRDGGFTSNAKLMREECKIDVQPSDQNWSARKESVELQLGIYDGLLIDSSCIRLINGFIAGYHYPEIQNSPGRYTEKPDKNKYSHIHEALQYVMLRLFQSARQNAEAGGFVPKRTGNMASSGHIRRH